MTSRRRWLLILILIAPLVRAEDSAVTLSGRVHIADKKQADSGNPQNVVVWLSPNGSEAPKRAFSGGPFRLTQHHKSFEPHILIVPVGAVVEFPNHDPFFHNVFSLFEGKRFDLGLYEAGTSKKVRFDRVGISYIFCNIHAEMSAVVISLDTPYYGTSDRRGQVVIPEVPAGKYVMHVWYETALPESLTAMSKEITVTPQSSTLGVLEVPSAPEVNAHKNKYGMDYEPPVPGSPGYEQQ